MINRKIFLSSLSIFSALAMLGGSAFAVFSSANTNSNNVFGAGDLVLKINTQAGTSTGVFNIPAAAPGDKFNQPMTLTNTGSITASSVKVSGITVGGANTDLSDNLTLTLYADNDASNTLTPGDTILGTGLLNDSGWTNHTLPGVTLAGTTGTYNLRAELAFDSSDNTDQGKSLTFDIGFVATQ